MILVDTSAWIDHLRADDALLSSSQVLMHPFIVGELACGNLRNRDEVLRLLQDMPRATVASYAEVLFFIERQHISHLSEPVTHHANRHLEPTEPP